MNSIWNVLCTSISNPRLHRILSTQACAPTLLPSPKSTRSTMSGGRGGERKGPGLENKPDALKYQQLIYYIDVIRMFQKNNWIAEHFEELVDKYAGLYIAVVDDHVVAFGTDPKDVEDESLSKYPDVIPSVLKVPKEEEMVCLL